LRNAQITVDKRDIVTTRKVTKVMWTKGQGGSRLILGGKAVLGEGCRASCDSSRDACFFRRNHFRSSRLSPAMILVVIVAAAVAAAPVLVRGLGPMSFMVSSVVAGWVPAVVSTSISRRVAVAVSTMILGRMVVVVRAAVAVMIIAYGGPNSRKSRVLAQARIVAVSPFPIFVPALTAQPVVVDVAIVAFGEPLAVARVFVGVPPVIAVAVVGVVG
jgi:hypothetical protein